MTNNELAYGLLEEIRASLIPMIEEEPFLSYRQIVERVLENVYENQLEGVKERDLWHTVYLHKDLCYFERLTKKNVQFLREIRDEFKFRERV